jgi:transposase InsO family protein
VRKLLREAGLGPPGERAGLGWGEFLRGQAARMLAAWPAAPSARAEHVTQQARNLTWSLSERPSPLRFLIHDRDSKLTDAVDETFRSEGISIIRTPVKTPQANAYAERFVGTVRRECLDWILILGRRQLERTLHIYIGAASPRRSGC